MPPLVHEYGENRSLPGEGAVNGYQCDACNRLTIVVHRDPGVTPMFLACRAEGLEPNEATCKGMGVSLMYPSGPPPAEPEWEWIAPTKSQMKRWKRDGDPMYEHCRKGGLVLRKIAR